MEILEKVMSHTGHAQGMFPYTEGMVRIDVSFFLPDGGDYVLSVTLQPTTGQPRMLVKQRIQPTLAQVGSYVDGVLTVLRREVPRYGAAG